MGLLDLLDRPLHRDWMFYWSAFWTVSTLVYMMNEGLPGGGLVAVLIDGLLKGLFFLFVFVVVPLQIRDKVRRQRAE